MYSSQTFITREKKTTYNHQRKSVRIHLFTKRKMLFHKAHLHLENNVFTSSGIQ